MLLSNTKTSTIDVSWTASTDNVAVTKYEIYANGVLNGETSTTNYTATGLSSNTNYSITVLAKDVANNKSAQSAAVNATTLTDNSAPSIPANVTVTSITGTSFIVNWAASTDDTGVTNYEIYLNGSLHGSTSNTTYTATGLTENTAYAVRVSAKDAANNSSAQSTAVNETTTTDGSNNIVELFFSEYLEGSGNNKALEIANITENPINLSAYSIKKQSNGAGDWINELPLTGTIAVNDVFVMIHYQADNNVLLAQADLIGPTTGGGTPVNFNGNDPVGLFKNGVLIDVIGVLDDSAFNFADMTLRRKDAIKKPNTTYTPGEWDLFPQNTFDGIGYHGNTASTNNYLMDSVTFFPNPANGNIIFFKTTENTTVTIYNVLGQFVKSAKITESKNSIDISNLSKGVFVIKMNIDKTYISKKLLRN